ncbi:hypothetical protein DOE51_09010 [Bdellovibrio sp. NC01]|nr:hypothetical protein DOE51_09010 [Bdellovibrio sp. NC01]
MWAVWIGGSSLAISDFLFNDLISKKILFHLSLIAWSPAIAITIFGGMLVAIRFSKYEAKKKTIANEHTVQWSEVDLVNAQSGKVVDLYFAGAGLDSQVVARDQVATVLHNENQTVHVTVAAPSVEDANWNLQSVVVRSIVILILLLPKAF